MPRKKTTPQKLKASIEKAKAENNLVLQDELQQILIALKQPWSMAFRTLAKLLRQATSQVAKHYIADVFGEAKDPQVLNILMRAAKAPENKNYSANFLWPCAQYDCTSYMSFFVQFLLQCQEPGEAMAACLDVIEEMQGPFELATIKRNIAKLLGRNRNSISSEWQTQDEVMTTQAAYTLLDKYFKQVDKKWKSEY